MPAIIEALVKSAKQGDVGAAKLILERVVPSLKSEELPVTLAGFSGTRAEMISVAVQAIADGKLDMSRGGRLIAALAPEAIEEKLAKFERMIEEQNNGH